MSPELSTGGWLNQTKGSRAQINYFAPTYAVASHSAQLVLSQHNGAARRLEIPSMQPARLERRARCLTLNKPVKRLT